MVQRCVDALAESDATIAILPAGTANLFASNLRIPRKIEACVDIGLNGERRRFDVGRINGERFAVMAGVGFDARVIRDATKKLKRRYGRSAYIWAASRNLRMNLFQARIDVDGSTWYEGDASVHSVRERRARVRAVSRSSTTRGPMTDCSRSASATRRESSSGAASSRGASSAAPRSRRSST